MTVAPPSGSGSPPDAPGGPSDPSRPSTLRAALWNQYQLILLAGAAGFTLVAGALWPLLILGGLELVVLPFLVGNPRFERLLAARRLAARTGGAGSSSGPLRPEKLDPEGRKRFTQLQELTSVIESNYARLSEASQPFLDEQRTKTDAILRGAYDHLRSLQAYDELDRVRGSDEQLSAEIRALEKKTESAGSDSLRDRYRQTLEFKKRLRDAVGRSKDLKEAMSAELESIETALRILAQESAALLAPEDAAARLDDVLKEAETAAPTIREFESLARDAGVASAADSRSRVGA